MRNLDIMTDGLHRLPQNSKFGDKMIDNLSEGRYFSRDATGNKYTSEGGSRNDWWPAVAIHLTLAVSTILITIWSVPDLPIEQQIAIGVLLLGALGLIATAACLILLFVVSALLSLTAAIHGNKRSIISTAVIFMVMLHEAPDELKSRVAQSPSWLLELAKWTTWLISGIGAGLVAKQITPCNDKNHKSP